MSPARPSALSRMAASVRSGRPDPLTSVALTIPVFLVYHLGILFIDLRNGVDWVSGLTLALLHSSIEGYVLVTVALAGALALAVEVLRRRGSVRHTNLLPIVAESVLWAFAMLVTVGWATAQVDAALSVGDAALGPLDKIVMAAGAGFHEEVVFRVGLLSGGTWLLLRGPRLSAGTAMAVSALVSSLMFSLVHHIGPMNDPMSIGVFTFRTFAGLFLSAVYLLRGFAVAVYTHTIYDALVFFVLAP